MASKPEDVYAILHTRFAHSKWVIEVVLKFRMRVLPLPGYYQPRSQALRGETVTKTLVKFVLSFQNFGKKIACAVRHNRIQLYCNTVVSHCACDIFPEILER